MTLPATTLTATTSTAAALLRPQPGEYAPYYDRYISLVHTNDAHSNDILAAFEDQRRQTLLLLSGRTEADGDLRYAPDKWTLKEVLGHINDTERIMSYRALRIARGDQTPIEGFEQDDYVRNGPFAQLALPDLIEDYIAVRRATISLFRNLDEPAWTRRGVANKNEITVRALAYIIAGHELHHRRIIEEKYLK
ncbi:MAG TPA: DinB family protein [Terriglobales bacterium]|nr:DinB family protein [Terriglobales bacterium]